MLKPIAAAILIVVGAGSGAAKAMTATDCLPISDIEDWNAHDTDTLSVFRHGHEIARIDIPRRGPASGDTVTMRLVGAVRFEAGSDGLLCTGSSDFLVLDGRRHFIQKVALLEPARKGKE